MLKLATDEDVNGNLVSGLKRKMPGLDLVRSEDVLGKAAPDPDVLAWATTEGRVLISNDRSTMTREYKRRLAAGQKVIGLIVTNGGQRLGEAIDDILFIPETASLDDFQREETMYLPY